MSTTCIKSCPLPSSLEISGRDINRADTNDLLQLVTATNVIVYVENSFFFLVVVGKIQSSARAETFPEWNSSL